VQQQVAAEWLGQRSEGRLVQSWCGGFALHVHSFAQGGRQ
jgi:hypothetical protein